MSDSSHRTIIPTEENDLIEETTVPVETEAVPDAMIPESLPDPGVREGGESPVVETVSEEAGIRLEDVPGGETPCPADQEPAPASEDVQLSGDKPSEDGVGEEKADSPHCVENLEAIMGKVNDLQETLNRLDKDFQGKLKYDQHKEQIIDTLHGELQDHRNDFLKKIRVPIIMDIIHVMDDLRKIIRHYREPDTPEVSAEKFLGMFDTFYDDLEEILYRQMVEPFSESDAEFNPSRQKATRTVATDDKSRDKTVARSLRDGFDWEGKVLRPELVEVNVYKENTSSDK